MNYARISDRPFVTQKRVAVKKTMSDEARLRKSYIEAHSFSFSVDPSTKEATVKVNKKDE